MSSLPQDPSLSILLNLTAHEIRNAAGAGTGFLGFLTRYGPSLTEQQQSFVALSQGAWGRLAALVDELELLAGLKSGEIQLHRQRVDIAEVLNQAIVALPPMDDGRAFDVKVTIGAPRSALHGDPVRLKIALSGLLFALRREVASAALFIREHQREFHGRPASWIAIAEADCIERLASATPDMLGKFNEKRGGCGLKPSLALSIIEAHGGALWSPLDGVNAGAVLVLPT